YPRGQRTGWERHRNQRRRGVRGGRRRGSRLSPGGDLGRVRLYGGAGRRTLPRRSGLIAAPRAMSMVPWLEHSDDFGFPPLDDALTDPNGLIAVGGDLSPARLI